MYKTRFILRIFLSFLFITLIGLSVITWYATNVARNFYLDDTVKKLETEAKILSQSFESQLKKQDYNYIFTEVGRLSGEIDTRITVILENGLVIADTDKDPKLMDNHRDRPEVQKALTGQSGFATRYSKTLQQNLVYFAQPFKNNDRIVAIIRTALPITSIEETLDSIRMNIVFAGTVILLITAIIGFIVSRQIGTPLNEMATAISEFAKGNFNHKISKRSLSEFSKLAEALEEMGRQLDEKIQTIDQQKNQQQAVLHSMAEGVLAFDQNQNLISINNAAVSLLGIDKKTVKGKRLNEFILDKQLQKTILKTFSSKDLVEDELILNNHGDHFVQVHGTQLNSPDGKIYGVLVVLNDVTRLRRLEQVRRDFVANVSHEIRTPLTSIKGFVEALNDGAIKDKKTAKRFVDIILRQTNRLNLIIGDLLDLATLEENEERSEIQFEEANLFDLIKDALHICKPHAKEKKIKIDVNCPGEISCFMNTSLIEQALVNLIENAIKYSPAGTNINVNYSKDNRYHIIEVKDQGIGISQDHINRIFERFYRVDKARSRKMGGTGLGLAIVKHIAKVHGGEVTVDSEENKGTSFYFHLPV